MSPVAGPDSARQFLVLHGLEGSGPGHWQPWLVDRLRQDGVGHVVFPELPDPFDPRPDPWLATLDRELAGLTAARLTVVCHSLACLLWLRAAASHGGALASRVLLVAPPWREDLDPVARFLPPGADPADVAGAAPETRIVCSESDPYCPGGALRRFGQPLGIPAAVVPGGGHLNTDAGYGPWPAAEAWARGREVTDWANN